MPRKSDPEFIEGEDCTGSMVSASARRQGETGKSLPCRLPAGRQGRQASAPTICSCIKLKAIARVRSSRPPCFEVKLIVLIICN